MIMLSHQACVTGSRLWDAWEDWKSRPVPKILPADIMEMVQSLSWSPYHIVLRVSCFGSCVYFRAKRGCISLDNFAVDVPQDFCFQQAVNWDVNKSTAFIFSVGRDLHQLPLIGPAGVKLIFSLHLLFCCRQSHAQKEPHVEYQTQGGTWQHLLWCQKNCSRLSQYSCIFISLVPRSRSEVIKLHTHWTASVSRGQLPTTLLWPCTLQGLQSYPGLFASYPSTED